MKTDLLYLTSISDAIQKIQDYTRNGRDSFLGNPMAQDAVIRNFEIIGEAAKRLSDDTKSNAPHLPWRSICGFRDVLIHDYMGVDIDEVWNVVTDHIPPLAETVQRLLNETP